ncbi:U6 small nuclear RNA (adenine-(43)-N(6))-methyltransferase [Bacillus rossius redtenbacheri]|uniref:U6 small nuclear RNA (adenine-(43)-N(6))-methyltransferase n=1 Tax=Bacillus rossius redtenbacheri TaxID=93214 RepID=UPI002FDCEA2D
MSHKQVHPRSPYRSPPSFKDMAIKYPRFRKFVIQDLSGRITIDFRNPEALHALTTTLLQRDFGLEVEMPLDRLIPTVPSRLNYVLWVEDLLRAAGVSADTPVHGIDIGTGASCIYSLLAAKSKGWHMLATDMDADSYKCAEENVRINKLEHLVQVKLVDATVLLKGVVAEGQQYDFCMCNPPFFSSEEELGAETKSRSPARPPPRGARTGSPSDVVVSGGEVAFVSNMVRESKELGTTIRVYSSLLGHKSSLGPVKALLQEAGVSSQADTWFCQGRTTRWYVAWTFAAGCDLQGAAAQTAGQPAKRKEKAPLAWTVPRPGDPARHTLAVVGARVKEMLQQLQMSVRGLRNNDKIQSYQVTAFDNTWSNQRKKRRAAAHVDSPKKDIPAPATVTGDGRRSPGCPDARCDGATGTGEGTSEPTDSARDKIAAEKNAPSTQEADAKQLEASGGGTTGLKRPVEDMISLSKKLKTEAVGCLLRAGVAVVRNGDDIVLEWCFLEGAGGREALHQVLQYFKNNFKL